MKQDDKKRKRIRNKIVLACTWCISAAVIIFCKVVPVTAADAVGDVDVFAGVTVSPDGTAWTTDYLDTTNEWLNKGYTISTGVASSLRELQTGEHYYTVPATGSINIGKWEVAWPNAQCIHEIALYDNFCGFPIKSDTVCYANYNNGWNAYCADCGELVSEMLFYAKSSTVSGITSIPASAWYVYICPHCQGLEQGRHYGHTCKDISNNYYEITYDANAPGGMEVKGFMSSTRHMYNNAVTYNGISVEELGYGDTRLRSNRYSCVGYKFVGWNTKADGSGSFYADRAEVLNLTTEDGGTVRLYAQWEKNRSTLVLDANGGLYYGEAVYNRTQEYGTTYKVNDSLITPAPGYEVTFDTNGGNLLDKIITTKSFSHWELQNGFQGSFQDNVYTFSGDDGGSSTLKAQYTNNGFILPDAVKKDASISGWYVDPDLSEDSLMGKPGDEIVVDEDTKLYAKWATLTLWAYDDYESNNGYGAVDLKWEQKDGQSKYYRLFQSKDRVSWREIFTVDTITSSMTVSETFGTDKQGQAYVVQQTGYYTLTANGAKGADFSTALKGGNGGSVSAAYWLQKGDIVTFYAGNAGSGTSGGTNQSGSGGGDSSSQAGCGGGAATEVYLTRDGTKSLLLIAGGGAGANESFAGGAGGTSLTEPGSGEGNTSDFGGGGGGAQGGSSGSTVIISTVSDTLDFAFRSNLTENLAAGTVQVYGMKREDTTPTLNKVTGNGQDTWKMITSMGNLSGAFNSSYSLWYTGDDFAFYGSSKGDASVGAVPYIQAQVKNGMTMHMQNTYETKGNTNLLIGGGLYREDYGAEGHTRLYFTVTNADTGEIIYNNCIYDGYSNNDKTGIAAVVDIDVSSASKVTVKATAETEGTFERSDGHKTQLYFSDIIFYGKKIANAAAATGGSSYINTGFGCKNETSSAGTNGGAGYAVIKSNDIGYKEETTLADVPARDNAAPNSIGAYSVSIADENKLKVTFSKPTDNGTRYYHMAKSYKLGTSAVQQLAASNITENVLTTGVKGYYYYVDTQQTGTVGAHNNWLTAGYQQDVLTVALTESVMYLHVAAVDGAGNIGPTKNIRLIIDLALPTDPTYAERRNLFTKQLALEESGFIYQESPKTYYVKADGVTEHKLLAQAYIDGAATQSFQIGSIFFRIGDDVNAYPEWLQVKIPLANVAENSVSYANEELSIDVSSKYQDFLKPETVRAKRSSHGVNISLEQGFSVSEDRSAFVLYPQAAAELSGQQYYSREEADKENGFIIIPDGTPPVIEGLDELAAFDILDMTEQRKYFELKAKDTGSGLKEFVIYVSNRDNFMKEEFTSDSQGRILVEIDKDNALFMGEIAISAVAIDRVGNANVVGEDGLTFTLETDLYKERNPEEKIFKTGDGAVLDITTMGYVEKLEVIFPEELLQLSPDLPLVYEYDYPYLRNTETIKFQIPLGIPQQEYEITVRAYKNGDMLVSKQTMVVVEGNVLDELRTRIRNNG